MAYRISSSVRIRMPSILAIFVVILHALVAPVSARTFNVVTFVSMTIGGRAIGNNDVAASYVGLIMAAKHFNSRNSTILRSIDRLNSCSAKLNLLGGLFDDQVLSSVAMPHLISSITQRDVDFINGPLSSDVAQTVGITAGALRIPMISYVASTEKLTDNVTYPTTFRNIPTESQIIEPLVELFDFYGYKTVAMVHTGDTYGNNNRDLVQLACSSRGIRLRTFVVDPTLTGFELNATMLNIVSSIKEQRLNIVLRTLVKYDQEVAFARATVALDYVKSRFHISRPQISPEDVVRAATLEDLPYLRELFNGTFSILQKYDTNTAGYTNFVREWPNFDVNYINQFFPNRNASSGQSLQLPPDYFSKTDIHGYLSFGLAYDSMIALGFAACGSSRDLTENLREVRFTGVSGTVRFNAQQSRYQEVDGINTLLINWVPGETGRSSITVYSSFDLIVGKSVGRYVDGNWSINASSIVFSDGTSRPPRDIDRDPVIVDRLPIGVKIWGWVEASLGTLFGMWALTLLFVKRENFFGTRRDSGSGASLNNVNNSKHTPRSIKSLISNSRSSLVMIRFDSAWLAIGTIMLALSIVPLTIESDAACMLFYWFFIFGYSIILASLTARATYAWISWVQKKKNRSKQENSLSSSPLKPALKVSSKNEGEVSNPGSGLDAVVAQHQEKKSLFDTLLGKRQQQQHNGPSGIQSNSKHEKPRSLEEEAKVSGVRESAPHMDEEKVGTANTEEKEGSTHYFLDNQVASIRMPPFVPERQQSEQQSQRATTIQIKEASPQFFSGQENSSSPSLSSSTKELIMEAKAKQARAFRISSVVMFGILLVVFACLLAFQLDAPVRFDRFVVRETDVDGYPLTGFATCVTTSPASSAYMIVLASIVSVLTAFSFVLSFKVRNAPVSLFDAHMAAVAGLCTFQIFFVGLPLLIAVWDTAVARFLILSSMAFLINIVIVVTMFLSRAFRWKFQAWNIPIHLLDDEAGGGMTNSSGGNNNNLLPRHEHENANGGVRSAILRPPGSNQYLTLLKTNYQGGINADHDPLPGHKNNTSTNWANTVAAALNPKGRLHHQISGNQSNPSELESSLSGGHDNVGRKMSYDTRAIGMDSGEETRYLEGRSDFAYSVTDAGQFTGSAAGASAFDFVAGASPTAANSRSPMMALAAAQANPSSYAQQQQMMMGESNARGSGTNVPDVVDFARLDAPRKKLPNFVDSGQLQAAAANSMATGVLAPMQYPFMASAPVQQPISSDMVGTLALPQLPAHLLSAASSTTDLNLQMMLPRSQKHASGADMSMHQGASSTSPSKLGDESTNGTSLKPSSSSLNIT